ncbi:hypothetical protein [Saccharopolyspora pogona]|uniref:hypothetical protein n=1 Tax=Saccharopolyspora pogona TaxID=333966 RepID=UPI001CC240A4|nr:hypothetical protein [Saccharopolyspora pogona]
MRFAPADRAFTAALLHRPPRNLLHRLRLLARPDTVPRLAKDNPSWGYRRPHRELLALKVNVAASTVWETSQTAGIDPAPERNSSTSADFLRSQTDALLASDLSETVTLSRARRHVPAVIEHASRRTRILGATTHPTATWVAQATKESRHGPRGHRLPGAVPDPRPGQVPTHSETVVTETGTDVVLSGVQMPRMTSIMERWVQTCRHEQAAAPGTPPGSPVDNWPDTGPDARP